MELAEKDKGKCWLERLTSFLGFMTGTVMTIMGILSILLAILPLFLTIRKMCSCNINGNHIRLLKALIREETLLEEGIQSDY